MPSRALTALALCLAVRAQAQSCDSSGAPILIGSEWEGYVRAVQVVGGVASQPWTVRGLGPQQWNDLTPNDTTLPWSGVGRGIARANCRGANRGFIFAPHGRLTYNSSFPLSYNDGAVWSGRGLTLAVDFGGAIVAGPLTVTLAPVVFSSQNLPFTLAPNGLASSRRFADWRNPGLIDLPQRFGDQAYTRADPGQSTVRLDAFGVTIGVSTANQFIGPAYDHPVILGNNAPGFPHLFIGSSRPVRIWRVGKIHGRSFWGTLGESEYSPLAGSGLSRIGSGVAVVFQPAALPGVELGGTQFVHVLRSRFSLTRDELLRPFSLFFNTDAGTDNHLASFFARAVLPRDALEIYGEFGREDKNRDVREFFFFPDHDSAYLLGLRKIWRERDTFFSVRAEVLNSRITHLALSSNQASWYVHAPVVQGHTNRGQALGSVAATGGGASVLSVERYGRRGRWRVEWHRMQLAEKREPAPDLSQADVAHLLTASVLRFGRQADIDLSLGGMYELNRHFAGDAFSVQTKVSVRAPRSTPR